MNENIYNFIFGERGAGKLYFISELVKEGMKKEPYTEVRYKATTVLKFNNYDDVFIFYHGKLTKYFPVAQCNDLNLLAKRFQSLHATFYNSVYGSFQDKEKRS